MNNVGFNEAYAYIIGKEPSTMVEAQLRKLLVNYTYQEIFNAIWYFYVHKEMLVSGIDVYGVGILSNPKNMEEALNYFKRLAETRRRAFVSAERSKNKQVEVKTVKRQKRKIKREEFDWDE